jgi:hypothetical protein
MNPDLLDAWNNIDNGNIEGITNYSIPSQTDINSSSIAGGGSPGIPIGSAISAGASILGGIGGFLQGTETQQADDYNASLAIQAGQFQVEEIDSNETQTLSTQKAMYAKSGVELSGSVLDTALATATEAEYSKEIATYNAESQANMDRYSGEVAKQQGEIALAGGLLKGAGSLLSL